MYIVSDVSFAKLDYGARHLWEVWVQKLNPSLTGAVGTNETMALIIRDAHWEGIG